MAKHWLAIVMAMMLAGASAPPVEPRDRYRDVTASAGVFDGVDGKVHANWQVWCAAIGLSQSAQTSPFLQRADHRPRW